MAQVGVAIDCRTADINSYVTLVNGLEKFFKPGCGVVQIDGS
jgi:hypothetical protein